MEEVIVPDSQPWEELTEPVSQNNQRELPQHGQNDVAHDDVEEDRSECKVMTTMSQRWLVTAWVQHMGENWTPRDFDEQRNGIEYFCWGLERAPSTGAEHFHVYLRFKSKKRMSTVIQLFGSNQIKCFLCKGTEQQCRDYVFKLGKHIDKTEYCITNGERGEFKAEQGKGAGHRSDLQEVAERVAHGALPSALAVEHPATYVRYFRGLEALAKAIRPEPPLIRDPPTIFYFWGPTNTGKSWRCLTSPNLGSYFLVGTGSNAFDGYNGQQSLIFDEWNYDQTPLNLMKKILDRYTFPIMCRYNNTYSAWTQVFLTSQHGPSQQYPDSPQTDRDALFRRLNGRCWMIEKREDQGGPSFDQIINSPPDF